MEWPLLIAIAILFILWAILTYKWVRAEQKVKALQQDKHGLQLDKLNLEREVAWLENKYNKRNLGKYVVELNDEVYLKKKHINFYRDTYIITNNAFEALSYEDLESAKEDAHIFGGKVLKHKPNLEVVG
ncbi:hypothetical protein [Staphylococcus pasteuri]|uniref:hypothetical protein n=1 Tax=Staphylococcus pasteuri TaxID=45972 RepID=UPI0036B531FC